VWWRVELDKDGSIKTCDAVEASQKGSTYLRFVEAETKAHACTTVKKWYETKKRNAAVQSARAYASRKAAGTCLMCTQPKAPGRAMCELHLRVHREAEQRRRNGDTSHARPHVPPAIQLAAERERGRVWARAHGGSEGRMMRRCLKQFDALGPEAFRAWLVSEIERRTKGT
jgi:hypothetical protein